MSQLPYFSPEQLNTLSLLREQSKALGRMYQSYAEILEGLENAHEQYWQNPTLQSVTLAFQSALLNKEAVEHLIKETKDSFYASSLGDWMP